MMCYCRPGDHLFSFFYWEIFHLILMIFISNYYIEYVFPPPDEFTSSSSVTNKLASLEATLVRNSAHPLTHLLTHRGKV